MVILGLGSNIGDRLMHLQAAVHLLAAHISELGCSSVYESKALLPNGAPSHWDTPFFNMAVIGKTDLSPADLLVYVKTIEKQLGRKGADDWSPREIDIDILAMDDLIFESETLIIPHHELLMRDFALLPLAELMPSWRYPGPGPHHHHSAKAIAAKQNFRLCDAFKKTDHTVTLHA